MTDGAGWRRGLVLDLETSPDPAVLGRVRDGAGRASVLERIALHRIDAVATLEFEIDGALEVRNARLWSMSDEQETAPLLTTVEALSAIRREGGLLATFNGVAHDLAIVRHRLLATGRTERIAEVAVTDHVDVMLAWAAGARYPRLSDLCASMGLPSVSNRGGGLLDCEAKCRLDVCATFVLLLHLLAADRGLPCAVVHRGWRAMSAAVLAAGVRDPALVALLRAPGSVAGR